VDLLLTDYLMPQVTGEELVARARSVRPHLPVLFVTAHTGAIMPVSTTFSGEAHVAKPVEVAVLTGAVMDLIGPPLPTERLIS
jgi:CheY-like chemotaxis protein